MATLPPFTHDQEDYIDRLNDLIYTFTPRKGGANVTANTQLVLADNGSMIDCTAALTLTMGVSTLVDGWMVFVNAISGGTVTITAPFVDGTSSKTVTVGNGAIISCNGVSYRIFRGAIT